MICVMVYKRKVFCKKRNHRKPTFGSLPLNIMKIFKNFNFYSFCAVIIYFLRFIKLAWEKLFKDQLKINCVNLTQTWNLLNEVIVT